MQNSWYSRVIEYLRNNEANIKFFIIPILFFLFDLLARALINVDIKDSGADMALIAVTFFATLIIDEPRTRNLEAWLVFFFLVAFLLPWGVSLWLVSEQPSIFSIRIDPSAEFIFLQLIKIRVGVIFMIFSWATGIAALIFSSGLLGSMLDHN
jgi:hypothetical protein